MSNKKQTAVEWLVEQLEQHHTKIDIKNTVVFQQAKAMEREQIEDAYGDALNGHRVDFCNRNDYYNKTYGGQDE
jgi:hypothetical protein